MELLGLEYLVCQYVLTQFSLNDICLALKSILESLLNMGHDTTYMTKTIILMPLHIPDKHETNKDHTLSCYLTAQHASPANYGFGDFIGMSKTGSFENGDIALRYVSRLATGGTIKKTLSHKSLKFLESHQTFTSC